MARSQFQLRIIGANVSPETVAAGDLAEIISDFEKAIVGVANARQIEIENEPAVSLVALAKSSNLLTISVLQSHEPVASSLASAVADDNYDEVPYTAQEALHQLSNRLASRAWGVEFVEKPELNIKHALISQEKPVPAPRLKTIRGTTTIYGSCIRVGGVTPRAQIKLLSGESLYIDVEKPLACELATKLYDDVALEGDATWLMDPVQLQEFSAKRLKPFQKTDTTVAFRELADAAEDVWDEIDAAEYARRVRYGAGA